jgi:hypothetical protein
MSKPYLLPDKYNSSKLPQEDYPMSGDNVIGISNSYIRKQVSQTKASSQQKTYQNMKEAIPSFVAGILFLQLNFIISKEKLDFEF